MKQEEAIMLKTSTLSTDSNNQLTTATAIILASISKRLLTLPNQCLLAAVYYHGR